MPFSDRQRKELMSTLIGGGDNYIGFGLDMEVNLLLTRSALFMLAVKPGTSWSTEWNRI